jgi:hypothetical protein
LLSILLKSRKKKATDRFMRDPRGDCSSTERFLISPPPDEEPSASVQWEDRM